jgi:hypothetical protein
MVVTVLYNLEKVTVAALVLSLVFAPTFPNAITAAWLAIIVRYDMVEWCCFKGCISFIFYAGVTFLIRALAF